MCSLINPAAMEKLTQFPTQTNTVMLWLKLFHVDKKGLYATKIESWIIVLFLILQFKKSATWKILCLCIMLLFTHILSMRVPNIPYMTEYYKNSENARAVAAIDITLKRLISPPFRFNQQTIAQTSSEHKGKYMHDV